MGSCVSTPLQQQQLLQSASHAPVANHIAASDSSQQVTASNAHPQSGSKRSAQPQSPSLVSPEGELQSSVDASPVSSTDDEKRSVATAGRMPSRNASAKRNAAKQQQSSPTTPNAASAAAAAAYTVTRVDTESDLLQHLAQQASPGNVLRSSPDNASHSKLNDNSNSSSLAHASRSELQAQIRALQAQLDSQQQQQQQNETNGHVLRAADPAPPAPPQNHPSVVALQQQLKETQHSLLTLRLSASEQQQQLIEELTDARSNVSQLRHELRSKATTHDEERKLLEDQCLQLQQHAQLLSLRLDKIRRQQQHRSTSGIGSSSTSNNHNKSNNSSLAVQDLNGGQQRPVPLQHFPQSQNQRKHRSSSVGGGDGLVSGSGFGVVGAGQMPLIIETPSFGLQRQSAAALGDATQDLSPNANVELDQIEAQASSPLSASTIAATHKRDDLATYIAELKQQRQQSNNRRAKQSQQQQQQSSHSQPPTQRQVHSMPQSPATHALPSAMPFTVLPEPLQSQSTMTPIYSGKRRDDRYLTSAQLEEVMAQRQQTELRLAKQRQQQLSQYIAEQQGLS